MVSGDRSPTGGGRELLDSLPPAIRGFLEETVQGRLLRFDVLRFFSQNPYAILSVSELSVWVSLEEKALGEALRDLEALGYLTRSRASTAYTLSANRDKRRRTDDFFDFIRTDPDLARRIRAWLRLQAEGE